jgi:predicted permease
MSTRGGRKRPAADFSEEIRAHLAIETDRLIEEGLEPEEARATALRRFGSVAAAEERRYESGRWLWFDRLRQDVRDAARSLLRYPVTSAIGILSIAAGLGVTAATLTIRDVIFHNPPPEYANPRQLSEVRVARGTQLMTPIGSDAPGGLVAAWSAALGPSSIGAAQPPRAARDVRTERGTESIGVRGVTPELFDVLGVRPVLGRTFSAIGTDGSSPAVLSYRLWQQWYDGRPDALGRTIWIENRPHTIIGVLPRRFWMSAFQPSVWTMLERSAIAAEDRLEVVVRRPDGMSEEALQHTLEPLMADYASSLPADRRQLRLAVAPVEGTPMAKQMSVALPWVLGVASMLTLLIACANVAVLMIARWTAREHEISIRASLGAGRARLMRTLLTESMLIAVCGGTLGVGSGYVLLRLFLRRSEPPEFLDFSIDPAIFLQSAAATLAAGLLVGIAPALLETRRLHGNPMRASANTEPLRQRWRHALVVLEISVTVALLVVASAFINGYLRTASANMGFDSRPMLSTRVENPSGVPIETVLDAIQGVAGVADAAAANTVPFTTRGPRTRVAIDASGSGATAAERAEITASFFATLAVPLRAGRAFTSVDTAGAGLAIVNDALARQLFGPADARTIVGRRVWIDRTAYDIVGVAADFANGPLFRDYDPRIFLPLPLGPAAPAAVRAAFVVRARDDPAAVVRAVRGAIQRAAPGTVVTSGFTFDTIRTISGQEILVGTAPLAPLILIGLLLTTAGIYGVLAFAISRRSRELAIRVAIGATGRDLARLVAAHSLRLFAAGAALGVGFTFGLSRLVRASGGGGSPFDATWPAFAVPIAIIAVIAALATWIPSRRVRSIEPSILLRSEI